MGFKLTSKKSKSSQRRRTLTEDPQRLGNTPNFRKESMEEQFIIAKEEYKIYE